MLPVKKRAIGGFLPLETAARATSNNLLNLWRVEDQNAWAFVNARSALAHLLDQSEIRRLFLPAYVCPELAFTENAEIDVSFYALNETLSPDVGYLRRALRDGDCLVGVDYFGRQPDQEFRRYVAEKPKVLWVEDRAQAMMPATEPWGDVLLYSPRKLFGVPDGGILVRNNGTLPHAGYTKPSTEDRALPRLHRLQDRYEDDNELWYAEYRQVEDRMGVSHEPMSGLTRRLLAAIDPSAVMQRRRSNYDVLAKILPDVALIEGTADDFVPLGFPIRLPNCDTVWASLRKARIFAARYWPSMPSDPDDFRDAHRLSRETLVLPCDQRYDEDDMRYVATAVRELVT